MAILQPIGSPAGAHGRRRFEVSNPATLERLGEIEAANAQDVHQAVERAREAQPRWASLGFEQRGRLLLRARDLLLERTDRVMEVLCKDTGKPRLEAYATEIVPSYDVLTFYAKSAARLLADEKKRPHLMKNKRVLVCYPPMGVVGVITPWNFPWILALNPAVQALAAGNTVVLKPSEVTPFVGMALGELFADAKLPEGVFQVVTGDASTGAALVDAGCDKIAFTGSVRTGRKIAEECGRRLVACTLELGGKDPMIVCEDADLDLAARGAVWGAFCNSGQVCMSVERVYVQERVAEELTDRIVRLARELRQGPESEGEIDVGALAFPAQLEVIERHVADAVEKGAKILAGGRRNPAFPGYFYEPTVLTHVDHTMAIMREETFGPTLPIQTVKCVEEAIELANDSSYGLGASVWSRDGFRARSLARRIRAANVTIDDCLVAYGIAESPFGGMKESGIGRVNGEMGLKSFCQVQAIVSPRFGSKPSKLWYPYQEKTLRGLRRAMSLLYRSPIGKLLGN